MSSRRNTRSRLARLNERLTVLVYYAGNGHDLKDAREKAKQDRTLGKEFNFPTYTQAYKNLKAIAREHREAYERDVRNEGKALVANVERQRKALRSTDIPSTQKAESKSRKQAKREAKGSQISHS